MQGIDFEDDRNFSGISSRIPVQTAKPSFMMRLLASVGVADSATANYILLGVAAIFFGITIFLYAGVFAEPVKDWSLDARALMEMQGAR
ncbi:MAG: hypothetical protein AAB497_01700 [Patescibacteria group bacterium]